MNIILKWFLMVWLIVVIVLVLLWSAKKDEARMKRFDECNKSFANSHQENLQEYLKVCMD